MLILKRNNKITEKESEGDLEFTSAKMKKIGEKIYAYQHAIENVYEGPIFECMPQLDDKIEKAKIDDVEGTRYGHEGGRNHLDMIQHKKKRNWQKWNVKSRGRELWMENWGKANLKVSRSKKRKL